MADLPTTIEQLLPAATRRPLRVDDLDLLYAPPSPSWVSANMAVTVDGAVELDGRSGAIGGRADRALFLHLRTLADVVLVGAATVRAEGYGPVAVDAAARERRAARGQAPGVPIAVVTGTADLDPAARLFSGDSRAIVLTTTAASPERRAALAAVADVEICGERHVAPDAALAALVRRQLRRVHCEGGPSLLGSLLGAGMVDELDITTSPQIAGSSRLRLSGGEGPGVPAQARLASLLTDGHGAIFARYLLGRP